MLRRYPRFKSDFINAASVTTIPTVSRADYQYQRNDPPFYSSAPQEELLNYEDSTGDGDGCNLESEQILSSSINIPSSTMSPSRCLIKHSPAHIFQRDNSRRTGEHEPRIRSISAGEVEGAYSPVVTCDSNYDEATSDLTESIPLPHLDDRTKTFKRRYWILFVYCLLTWFSCVEWTSWGPICESVFVAFPDWNSFTIAMMENWVSFVFLFCVLPVCWLTGRIGLRLGVLMSSLLLAIGLALRCITDTSPLFTIMCHVCAILIGISMTVTLSAPPMVASVWFSKNERTTAVALIFAVGQLGTVGSYLEPIVIKDPSEGVPASAIKSDIVAMMYVAAGVGTALFLIILIYFPARPPLPPSFTSSAERLDFKRGLIFIIRNKTFIVFVTMYGIAVGPSLGWIGVLNFSLEPLGFNQDDAMYVGLVASFSCCVVTVITGRLTDLLYGRLKETIIGLLLASAVSYYWFLLLWQNVIPLTRWQIYASVSLGLSFNYATIPLFYELSVEIVYPAHEVLVGGVVTAFDSLSTTIFLFIYSNEAIGFGWVNYVLVASNALPVLAMIFIQPQYVRDKLDMHRSYSEL